MWKRTFVSSAAAALAGGVGTILISSAASADITVTSYSLPDSAAFGSVTTNGYSYYTGPIVLHSSVGDVTVYCADLNHDIYNDTPYSYAYGLLMETGLGTPLSETLSNKLGQIAQIGFNAFAHGDNDLAVAAQAAIWGLEYGVTPAISDSTIESDYSSLVSASYTNDGHRAVALTPTGTGWWENGGASQQMIVAAPEASTWAMLALGFLGLGYASFHRSRKDSVSALA